MNSNNERCERYTNINKIEKDLYIWFNEEKDHGTMLSVSMIQEKACQLNKSFNGDPNFAASNGWLSRWMKRYKIINLDLCEENTFETSYKSIVQRSDSDNLPHKNINYVKIDNIEPYILFIEPFYGGSHRQLIDTLLKEFGTISDLVTLSSKKWPWRARCSALTLSQIIPKKASYKVLFCSSVLNLSELLGLRPDLQTLQKVVYFHENQLVYPKKEVKKRDFQFGYNQITTCLAANHIIFNSMYNLNSFLWNINKFIKIMPDCRPQELYSIIKPKTSTLSFPINFTKILKTEKNYNANMLHIIWPHRWEFDKGPEDFFSVLFRLKSENINFKISVLGEKFSKIPEIFDKAKNILETETLHWGYAESKNEYYDILNSGHIVVSTAIHEFYGVAMLEAVHCGCYPLVPDRLVYPEIYDKECLYKDEDDLFSRLKFFCNNPATVEKDYANMTINLNKYDSKTLMPEFKKLLLHEIT